MSLRGPSSSSYVGDRCILACFVKFLVSIKRKGRKEREEERKTTTKKNPFAFHQTEGRDISHQERNEKQDTEKG
ncbi:hypothetical protein CSUI_006044 [Cystoisospora suis]|uniref:Uncharacterized protein n=1 Tax=Cystoisospora suis TaxID=483139 RepID=A0A2C6KVG1_9APIC|nr:hypothetical protein CSUI_006044 [Cystoisospora suis]